MVEDRTNAPSAEELKRRIEDMGAESNLGAGSKEPDPATAADPPADMQAGTERREQH